jgi:AAA+ ATPase superfamily predicted ATPase
VDLYDWPLTGDFLNRERELARLEEWWNEPTRDPLSLYGRRRVGKSWLLRRFAHGKPTVILAAERLAPSTMLGRFAGQLEPWLGLRPELVDLAGLFRLLFSQARRERSLVVIDEFPWLLPTSESDAERVLSSIQAAFEEERETSRLKLVLCGSQVGQMEALMSERNPLHGRLVPLQLRPLSFDEAAPFLAGAEPLARIERYAVAGGMPRYLAELTGGSLRDRAIRRVLDRNGPLWDEARIILDQELRQPATYFSILEQLAGGDKHVDEIASRARLDNTVVSRYLATLEHLRIVARSLPIGAPPTSRAGHWRLIDPFFRFWFRFVFPYQVELEAGLRPSDLWDNVVAPQLADHVAPTFEDLCRAWIRVNHGARASRVGSWWGNALDHYRRSGERTTEEIDIVGLGGNAVTVVGECRWRTKPVGPQLLHDLLTYKIPALGQSGHTISDELEIFVFSRAGFTAGARRAANESGRISLVDAKAVATARL